MRVKLERNWTTSAIDVTVFLTYVIRIRSLHVSLPGSIWAELQRKSKLFTLLSYFNRITMKMKWRWSCKQNGTLSWVADFEILSSSPSFRTHRRPCRLVHEPRCPTMPAPCLHHNLNAHCSHHHPNWLQTNVSGSTWPQMTVAIVWAVGIFRFVRFLPHLFLTNYYYLGSWSLLLTPFIAKRATDQPTGKRRPRRLGLGICYSF